MKQTGNWQSMQKGGIFYEFVENERNPMRFFKYLSTSDIELEGN